MNSTRDMVDAITYQSYLASLPGTWRQQDRADALETLAHLAYQSRSYLADDHTTDLLTDLYHVFAEDNAP